MCMRSTNNVGGQAGSALGLGHLGNHLGALTRERSPNFGAKIEIYFFLNIFFEIKGKKLVLHFSSIFKKYQRIE